jgi:transposase
MSNKSSPAVATMGVDIGKNSFHVIGLDARGAIVLRQKWSRAQLEARVANLPPCLIGMEACVGAHHLGRKLQEHTRPAARHRCHVVGLRRPRDARTGSAYPTPPVERQQGSAP